jgi:UDP-N-acetylglucosamine 1-carboxyvinyltransferase
MPIRPALTIPPELSSTSGRARPGFGAGAGARAFRRVIIKKDGALMDRISIVGGQPLHGTIPISGAKNAALPLMIASLLTPDTLILENVPRLADVALLQRILNNHGVDVMVNGKRPGDTAYQGQTLHISAAHIVDTTAPYELVSKMRASFWVIAPLVARMGEAKVSMPGGCAIGTRPVDLLILALQSLGAEIEIDRGYVIARARNGLRGGEVVFPKVTVGGTHTALMAASLAHGTTVIENAAREPEIADVADCLNKMGAKISGAGTAQIVVEGVPRLSGARHSVLPDRIETGTYAMAVAMTGGDVMLEGARPELLRAALDVLTQAGAEIAATNTGIRVARNGAGIAPVDVTTAPFPGFPTDLQAQFMALMTRGQGTSRITETIFENRFMHVQELVRLGARIHLAGETATIEGPGKLKGAPVMATDLRASVSLVIAALAAEGETMVNRVYHLDRGFERLEDKLAACGAQISRISG